VGPYSLKDMGSFSSSYRVATVDPAGWYAWGLTISELKHILY